MAGKKRDDPSDAKGTPRKMFNVEIREDLIKLFATKKSALQLKTQRDLLEPILEVALGLDTDKLLAFIGGAGSSPFETLYEMLEHWVWTDHAFASEPAWALQHMDSFPDRKQSAAISRLELYRRGLLWLQLARRCHIVAVHALAEENVESARTHYQAAIDGLKVANLSITNFLNGHWHKYRAPMAHFNRACCNSLMLMCKCELAWLCNPDDKRAKKVRSSLLAKEQRPNPTLNVWRNAKSGFSQPIKPVIAPFDDLLNQIVTQAFHDLQAVVRCNDDGDLPTFVYFAVIRADDDPDLVFLRSDATDCGSRYRQWRGDFATTVAELCSKLATLEENSTEES